MPIMDFLAFGKLAVAAVSDDEKVLASVREMVSEITRKESADDIGEDVNLLGSLYEASAGLPHAWAVPALALLAIENELVEFDLLTFGRLHCRIDAVFDMFATNFCAHQIQELFLGFLEYLVEAAKDPSTRRFSDVGQIAAAFAGGFVGGWFGIPGAAQAAASGARWLLEVDEPIGDPLVTAAKVLTLFELLPEDDDLFTTEESVLHDFARDQAELFGASGISDSAVRTEHGVPSLRPCAERPGDGRGAEAWAVVIRAEARRRIDYMFERLSATLGWRAAAGP